MRLYEKMLQQNFQIDDCAKNGYKNELHPVFGLTRFKSEALVTDVRFYMYKFHHIELHYKEHEPLFPGH